MSDDRASLGESPLWHRIDQVFYWVDINADRVYRGTEADGSGVDVVFAGEKVTALAETDEGGLFMVTPDALLRWRDGSISSRVPISIASGTRTNDGKCDSGGRMWFGTMDLKTRQPIGSLYVYDGGSVRTVERAITLSNGLGWSPDHETMYHIDSIAARLYVYRYDGTTGQVGDRRVLVDMADLEGSPDGLAVDTSGNIWVAMYDGWCINVFDSTGQRIHLEELRVQKPTSVAFGGPELDRLYVTTASQELDDHAKAAQPEAGKVLVLDPGVSGEPVGVFGSNRLRGE